MSVEDDEIKLDIQRIKSFVRDGLFSHQELAKALCMSVDRFGALLDDGMRILIDKAIVDSKASLIKIMQELAEQGTEEDKTRFSATKYLLAALHGMTERNSIDRAELLLKQQNQSYNQTLRAAQMATKWEDADVTAKFISNVKKISKEVYG